MMPQPQTRVSLDAGTVTNTALLMSQQLCHAMHDGGPHIKQQLQQQLSSKAAPTSGPAARLASKPHRNIPDYQIGMHMRLHDQSNSAMPWLMADHQSTKQQPQHN
jgi:hypothetical protein